MKLKATAFKLVSSEIKISNDLGANSAYFKVGEFLSQDGRLLNVSSSLGFKEGYQLEVSSSGVVGDYTLIQDDSFWVILKMLTSK